MGIVKAYDYAKGLLELHHLDELSVLYKKPLPASRSGSLYSAFSYPTKISPESIAVFIASHTKPGDTVLDTFGGSGTTGLAVHLCANPPKEVIELADKLGAPVMWGPRKAVVYELSVVGSFVARTMCNPPESSLFLEAVEELLSICEQKVGGLYQTTDDQGHQGMMRHAIWSDILICDKCNHQVPFWDAVVTFSPLQIHSQFTCPSCHHVSETNRLERVYETYDDHLTGQTAIRRKRVLKRIYGQTGQRKWHRPATTSDEALVHSIDTSMVKSFVPIVEIPWGDLYRSGYHRGITHAHHFYTPRNLLVMSTIWQQIEKAPPQLQDALRLLALSYNATHGTLMTRVVVKSGQKDFVLTGAQSGVLYISSLPVEKNICEGLRRKAKTISSAFALVGKSGSSVHVVHGSSTKLDLPDHSVDYVFTDPPFGDYIPYAEINFLNEVWLGQTTDRSDEIIVSSAQKKTVSLYATMLTQVFKEISRTLKGDGQATVVFHSARADVWAALQEAYESAGLSVKHASILDKLQGSFKQVASSISVKGDPLFLLTKGTCPLQTTLEMDEVITQLIHEAMESSDEKERTFEWLYSRFVARYLAKGLMVPMDASEFYKKMEPFLEVLSNG